MGRAAFARTTRARTGWGLLEIVILTRRVPTSSVNRAASASSMNKEAFCSVPTPRFTESTKRLLPYITFVLAIIALRWTGATAAAQEGEKEPVTATRQY